VDRDSHLAPDGWPGRKLPCSASTTLVAGAGAVCTHLKLDMTAGRLRCWALNGGKEIALPKQVRGYVWNSAARSSARVIAEKWGYDRAPWWDSVLFWWVPVPGWPDLPQGRMAFDLHSGKLISSWKTRLQDSRNRSELPHPYMCALSNGGEFVSESGNGWVELYRITP
jgi:hypothetical protein